MFYLLVIYLVISVLKDEVTRTLRMPIWGKFSQAKRPVSPALYIRLAVMVSGLMPSPTKTITFLAALVFHLYDRASSSSSLADSRQCLLSGQRGITLRLKIVEQCLLSGQQGIKRRLKVMEQLSLSLSRVDSRVLGTRFVY